MYHKFVEAGNVGNTTPSQTTTGKYPHQARFGASTKLGNSNAKVRLLSNSDLDEVRRISQGQSHPIKDQPPWCKFQSAFSFEDTKRSVIKGFCFNIPNIAIIAFSVMFRHKPQRGRR